VARVDESKLSPVELAEARVIHDVRIPPDHDRHARCHIDVDVREAGASGTLGVDF
jgi:hypothetical protein